MGPNVRIAIALSFAHALAGDDPTWVAWGRTCAALVSESATPGSGVLWDKLHDAEARLRETPAPTLNEIRAYVKVGGDARGAAFAALSVHPPIEDEAVQMVLQEYRAADALGTRVYAFRALAHATPGQVQRNEDAFLRVLGEEPNAFVLVQASRTYRWLDHQRVVPVLRRIAVTGNPVTAILMARELGLQGALKSALLREGAQAPLRAIEDLERKEQQGREGRRRPPR